MNNVATRQAVSDDDREALACTWVVGDVQGCLDELLSLVAQLPADARLWLVGDLVNRGPRSLDTLRWVMNNSERVVSVLGNHDLHLLAVASGARRMHRGDTLQEILDASDRAQVIDWVRRLPLAHHAHGWLMVHAGILPQWSASKAAALAHEVQDILSSADWQSFLASMYGNEPDRWDDDLQGVDRLRVIVNALTRMRFCTPGGRMDFESKGEPSSPPPGHLPWFDVRGRASAGEPIVFGHWSTLGLMLRPDAVALDTGCVWGGLLTAMRLSDRALVQVSRGDAANAAA